MKKHRNEMDIAYLNKIFKFDAESGVLVWRVSSARAQAGVVAGTVTREGYVSIGHKGTQYQAHRIVWAMHYGEWPSSDIDHINGVKSDNRISNLRLCNDIQNQRNVNKKCNGRHSKHKGVDRHKSRWRARIRTGDGKRLDLGYFHTEEEAAAAYAEAARKFHGEFARL